MIEVEKAGYSRFRNEDEQSLTSVRFKRPPRSSKEAIKALKEAD